MRLEPGDKPIGSGAATSGGTRTETVLRHIREGILNGRYAVSRKLLVEQLRQEFSVSAGTVREALSRLMTESLVTAESQRGFRVAEVSLADFREIAEMRKTLEIMAVHRSMERGGDEWEANIVAAYHRLSKIEERLEIDDATLVEEWTRLNQAYHDALVAACGNTWLLRFREILHGQSNRYIRLALQGKTIPRDVHSEHEAIFEAVMARDLQEAGELLDLHIERTVTAVARKLEAVTLQSGG